MTDNKSRFGTFLSWILLFIILCALGISTYQSYIGIKIQNDFYSKIWDTIQVPTTDEDGNEILATNVIYKMNIYDYADAVLVNIPAGSNDCFYGKNGHPYTHQKYYIKYLKNSDGSLTFDGVIVNGGWRNVFGTDIHDFEVLGPETERAKDLLQKTFEYIFVGDLMRDFISVCQFPVIDFDYLNKVEYDYLVTWQQQTDESHAQGGIFAKMYDIIVSDAMNSNTTSKTYTKQFLHNTSDLQYVKCFVDNECINANIYCEYTRTMFTHSLPDRLDFVWYENEILGGNA